MIAELQNATNRRKPTPIPYLALHDPVAGLAVALEPSWCQNGTMKRMNLRDVPDDVYAALAEAAEANRQSLSSFVVDRLSEVAQVARLGDYVASYAPPTESRISLRDAADAVRKVREAS